MLTRDTPGQSKTAEIDITGVTKLYLNVRNGGDDTAWDHANWLTPTLSNGSKSLPLTSLPWENASAGWGKTTVNKSVSGGPLVVAGKTYPEGIGTHSNSIIEYDLPAGYTKLTTTVGLDKAAADQNTGGTLQFLVFTKSPYQPAPLDSAAVAVNLAELGLAGPCTLRDLWTGKTVGTVTGEFAPYVRRHGAHLYRISKRGTATTK